MRRQKPAQPGVMRRLDGHLRGAVLDHLYFSDMLRATATDRASRAALRCVKFVNGMKAASLSCVSVVAKLTHCRILTVEATSPEELAHLVLPLTIMKDLFWLGFIFDAGAVMQNWQYHCDRLVRTGAMRQAQKLMVFEPLRRTRADRLKTLKERELQCAAYKSLLFQMPLDCALRCSVDGKVPEGVCLELIGRGANVNSVVNRITTLQLAVETQRIEVIRTLLAGGADPNHSSCEFTLPLLAQAMSRSPSGEDDTAVHVVKLLLEFGVNAGYAASDGCTALHLAAENYGTQSWAVILEIAQLLMNHKPALANALWTFKKIKKSETPLGTLMRRYSGGDLPPGAAAVANILADAEARNRFNERKRR